MTTTTFELCSHPLSLVQGIYVIIQGDALATTCNTIDLVHEWLDGVKYEDAHKVRIYLSSVDDFDTDEITHMIASDTFSEVSRSYTEWSEYTGRKLPWLEWWMDEYGRVHQADYDRRRMRSIEINGKVA